MRVAPSHRPLALLTAGAVLAGSSAACAQGFPSYPANVDAAAFLLETPLGADELASSLGALERGGITTALGVTPSSRDGVTLPKLPAAPEIPGVSARRAEAVKVVINDVVPRVLTTLVGSEVPTSNANAGAAPLFAGFTFLPIPGRP